jgi:adenine-specific DNA-methyltransferase
MSNKKQKLELTWIGKNNPEYDIANIEPRILVENPDLSNVTNAPDTENMIIHGDNLLALKALLPEYEGKVKCIYIDPPYNTGNAFEHYDDSVEHSTWLSLMRPRLELLRMLLSEEGSIYIQIDDEEFAYLKVLCDEIFGRENFINCITVKTKSSAGASGGGEDKKLKKNTEFLMLYAKNRNSFFYHPIYVERNLMDIIEEKRDEGKQYEYRQVLLDKGQKSIFGVTQDGSGAEIKVYKHENYVISSISELVKKNKKEEDEVYFLNFDNIFRSTNAQTSIRTRVAVLKGNDDGLFSIEYVPRSGKNRGLVAQSYFIGEKTDLLVWLHDTARKTNSRVVKLEKLGTLWTDLSWNGLSSQGDVKFSNGKKPELLLERVLSISSKVGDLVLDSFLGSGSTAAVAHKMGRKYIGIEMGEHAYTHCKVRLDKVIDGSDQGGISKAVEWQGGGGYKFFELAPSFIGRDEFGNAVIDTYYDDAKLVRAMCKLMNFTFAPSQTEYWKQGVGQGKNFLYVTTQLLTVGMVQQIAAHLADGESLIIAPKKYEPGADTVDSRITIKKIPQSVLKSCHYGKKEYLLPIRESAIEEIDEEDDTDNE